MIESNRLPQLPLRRCESAEDLPVHVQNQGQCDRVPVAAAVKAACTETVVAAAPQKSRPASFEILKKLRKVRNDCGIPPERLDISESFTYFEENSLLNYLLSTPTKDCISIPRTAMDVLAYLL
jgi:hypothetical protein